ncbi:MAG: tRNA (adenosine(37)-N6)-threonylcarbamoyltransferase complex ATPase subunit type 1 TsaE, partial [Deltaproteobacteria bacterium]|nr:tRNA (adenosine(37)-N6)-threonylcarbamoyltransferase complex ATPase subunit type 1 TsaE [Deltaproteobacteria bacterium]
MELRILCRTQMVRLGRALASCLKEGDWLFVEGPLGVGKTFLIRGIARGLGVPLEVPIQSPTFALIHEYAGRVRIVHVDAYRI